VVLSLSTEKRNKILMSILAKQFRDLHSSSELLILPNAWDAGSARLFEDAGAKAIATTSAGVCWALGYSDGNTLPVEKLAALVGTITEAIHVPLSVDVEGGYTDDPKKIAQKLKPILEAGAIGINIEDGEGQPELLAGKIEQVRKTAESAGVQLFINARTDVYLNQVGKPESWVEETISRATKYQAAGADGLFVPGITEASAIRAVADGIKIPLNVMARPGLLAAKELTKLGVRRLSAGGAISQVVWNHAYELAKKFLHSGDSEIVVNDGMSYSRLQGLFTK
jgi:2-methylisocitrate lyase-like PEP mutase family enzyme